MAAKGKKAKTAKGKPKAKPAKRAARAASKPAAKKAAAKAPQEEISSDLRKVALAHALRRIR